jgi:PadR family transcriptional regulator AphA
MPRENKSKYALIGILSLGPMSGYDIKKTIEVSLGNFWSESYGQIYPILKSLVEEGLATGTVVTQTGKPDRHVYALTDAGRQELQRWLRGPSEYEVGRSELLLKLFFGWQVPADESRRRVEAFRGLQQGLLKKYKGIEQWVKETEADEPGLPYWLMTVSYGKHVSRALVEWCEETLAALRSMDEPAQPDPAHLTEDAYEEVTERCMAEDCTS